MLEWDLNSEVLSRGSSLLFVPADTVGITCGENRKSTTFSRYIVDK